MSDTHRLTFHFDGDVENVVERVTEGLFDAGFATMRDGRTDRCERYHTDEGPDPTDDEGADLDRALDEIAGDMPGGLYFWGEGVEVRVTFDCDPTAEARTVRALPELTDRIVELSVFNTPLSPVKSDEAAVRRRIQSLVDAVRAVAERTEPRYVWHGYEIGTTGHFRDKVPTGRSVLEGVDKLGWLTVLSPEAVEALGGAAAVLRTPAWISEELSTGHVLLVRTDNPLHPTEGAETPLGDHLLGDEADPDR